ncbi:MAG: DUF4250 domain-containing protein [Lachnospiraceae bacterium]|nr:DUF4250 domain-containing protein [Lachnospiraceae bacterium]
MIPEDPVILLSFVNTWLRDHPGGLDAFADDMEMDAEAIESMINRLSGIGYTYDGEACQFR